MSELIKMSEKSCNFRSNIIDLKLDICRALAKHKDLEYLAIETALIDVLHSLKGKQISDMFNEGSK